MTPDTRPNMLVKAPDQDVEDPSFQLAGYPEITVLPLAIRNDGGNAWALIYARGRPVSGSPVIYRVVLTMREIAGANGSRVYEDLVGERFATAVDEINAELVRRTPHCPGLLDRLLQEHYAGAR